MWRTEGPGITAGDRRLSSSLMLQYLMAITSAGIRSRRVSVGGDRATTAITIATGEVEAEVEITIGVAREAVMSLLTLPGTLECRSFLMRGSPGLIASHGR